MLDNVLLEILVCPVCKGHLLYDPKKSELLCRFDRLAFPVRQGIPEMVVEKARRITEDE